MKKKILSTIVSMALVSSCVAVMNSGAISGIYNGSLSDDDFAGYIKVEDEKYWTAQSFEDFVKCYIDISQAPEVKQVLVGANQAKITYKISNEFVSDENIDNILNSSVKEINSAFDISINHGEFASTGEEYIKGGIYPHADSKQDAYFTAEEVRKIKETLSPYVDEMEYIPESYSISTRYGRLTTFRFGEDNKDHYIEELKRVVEESGVDAEVSVYEAALADQYDDCVLYNPPGTTDYFLQDPFGFELSSGVTAHIVPGEGVTNEELYELSKKVTDEVGLRPYYLILDSANYHSSGSIDLYNSVAGDANNDGELGIADATLVLQHIGNGDKYPLSAQGEYNADIDGNEGITVLDALEIQKIDAQLS